MRSLTVNEIPGEEELVLQYLFKHIFHSARRCLLPAPSLSSLCTPSAAGARGSAFPIKGLVGQRLPAGRDIFCCLPIHVSHITAFRKQ